MKCSVCGGNLKAENGIYMCTKCNLSLTDHNTGSTDVFICCTQFSPQGTPTPESKIARELYVNFKSHNINAFYAPSSFAEYPETDHLNAFESAISSARIVIITGSGRMNFQNMISSYGDRIKNKAVLPVYTNMTENDIVQIPEMFPAINYDAHGAADTIYSDVQNILNLLDSKELTPTTDTVKKKKKKTAAVFGICAAALAFVVIVAYMLFVAPKISDAKNYTQAQTYTQNSEYTKAINLYYKLGNYKDTADHLGKIYTRYNGFYQDSEKMLELDLGIVNGTAKIKINEHYGNKVVTAKTSAKAKGCIINFDYEDSSGTSGSGSIELFDDYVSLTINTQAASTYCISGGTTKFLLNTDAEPFVTADADEITKKDLLTWLDNGTTKPQLESMGYTLVQTDETNYKTGITSTCYNIEKTDITLEFLTDSDSTGAPLFDVWAPASFIDSEKIGQSALPYEHSDVVYWPGKSVYRGDKGLRDANVADFDSKIRKSTIITITTKKAYSRNGSWDSLISDVFNCNIGANIGSNEFFIEAENNEKYLVSVNDGSWIRYYEVDKNTYAENYITKISISSEKTWRDHPNLFPDFEDVLPEETNIYRVRTSADNEESQIGAFLNLENAKKLADSNKNQNYKVYDQNGNMVYEP